MGLPFPTGMCGSCMAGWGSAHVCDEPRFCTCEQYHLDLPTKGVEVQRYVVGFAYDELGRVALIRKNRPAWQDGKLNGIGGHVEDGETFETAMVREFAEETGVVLAGWQRFVEMEFPGAVINFYRRKVEPTTMLELRPTTDEPIVIVYADQLKVWKIIPNLTWLIPLAMYEADHYKPIHVVAEVAEVLS